jgi:hypothetical protein
MRISALLIILLLLSACVEQKETPPTEVDELGMGTIDEPALEELPEDTTQDDSLLGEPMDLGSII